MEKFRCIGGACEDSCCAGWRVVFDKRTAQSYLDAKDPEIRDIANKTIKKIKTDRSSQNHSFIQMNPQTGACPFLQTDKLCMIQGKMGESALSKVCTTYPRHTGGVAGRQIEVATLSCPEAARLCLLDPDAMKIGEGKISSAHQLSLAADPPKISAIRYLHQTAVEMLEDDRVSITEFVLVYGSALNMLRKRPEQAFTEDRRFDEMQSIIKLIRSSLADSQSNAVQARAAVQFQLGKVLPILVRHARNNLRNERFQKSFLNALSGILPDPNDIKASAALYMNTINDLSTIELNLVKSALRNYLINDLLKNSTLYSSSPTDALRGLQASIVRCSIFVVQLVGRRIFARDGAIEEQLPLIISSTARAFEHNTAIMNDISSYLDGIEDKSIAVLGMITPRLE
jgi:lysine-N-methylase